MRRHLPFPYYDSSSVQDQLHDRLSSLNDRAFFFLERSKGQFRNCWQEALEKFSVLSSRPPTPWSETTRLFVSER